MTETGHTPRIVLVTGGTGGLGDAILRRFAAAGDTVVFTYARNAEAAAKLVGELNTERVSGAKLDVTDPAACKALIDEILALHGRLDVLIHAAGPHIPQIHLSKLSPETMATQLDADALGFYNVVHPALPALRATAGNVVAMTSAGTLRYPARDGLSVIAKAAVEMMVKGFAVEEGRFGVRFNAVGPGMTTTGMAVRLQAEGHLDDKALDAARNNIPLRRFGDGEDIAALTFFLASAEADYITGQKIDVDGGYSA